MRVLSHTNLMGDNKEFNDSAIFFWGILLIVGGGKL